RGLFLDRRVFLISYDPTNDEGGSIVEGILLAAGPVGAGIALEYYFSSVDNERFGCGSKVTHNLTGLFGVMEGADSDLRTGLPWQMVEIHEPMRLLVVVEQTPAVLEAIVARQPALQELIGNAWIVVASCDPDSGALQRYCPRRGWLPWAGRAVLPQVARSADWFAGEAGPLPPALLLGGAA
ncbi:MAG TPA: putative inorganic carbon transporter subunit DabA, partial [Azonexus sp.]